MEALIAFITKPKDFDWEWTTKAILSHFALGYWFSLISYPVLMRFFSKINKKILFNALWVSLFGGVASVLIDLDHFPLFIGEEKTRFLHPFFGAVSAAVALFTLLRLVIWFLDKFHKKEINLKRTHWNICALVWAGCFILHIVEDYTLGWF